jgi:hypothetical protein
MTLSQCEVFLPVLWPYERYMERCTSYGGLPKCLVQARPTGTKQSRCALPREHTTLILLNASDKGGHRGRQGRAQRQTGEEH